MGSPSCSGEGSAQINPEEGKYQRMEKAGETWEK
jgi:hypothetical protein